MSGNNTVRFCDQCQLNVFDISRMTRAQAASFIATSEGRICARLYLRPDGKILTKDCPVGLRAIRRKIAKAAGAACTALISLSASVLGQRPSSTTTEDHGSGLVTITRSYVSAAPQSGPATFLGAVFDPQGEPVRDAQATLINQTTKSKRFTRSNKKGLFRFGLLEPGSYTVIIIFPGFTEFKLQNLSLHSKEEMRYDVTLQFAGTTGVVVFEEPRGKGINVDGVRVTINEE
jgi:hypothetical protein